MALLRSHSGSALSRRRKAENEPNADLCTAYAAVSRTSHHEWSASSIGTMRSDGLGVAATSHMRGSEAMACTDALPAHVRQLHLRELKEKKLVDISFVPTAKNVSDILTKALDPVRFEMLRSSFMHYVP